MSYKGCACGEDKHICVDCMERYIEDVDKPLAYTTKRECPECGEITKEIGETVLCEKCHGSGILTTTYQFVVERKCKGITRTDGHLSGCHAPGACHCYGKGTITRPATVEDLAQATSEFMRGRSYRTRNGTLFTEISYKDREGNSCTLKLVEVKEGK